MNWGSGIFPLSPLLNETFKGSCKGIEVQQCLSDVWSDLPVEVLQTVFLSKVCISWYGISDANALVVPSSY